MRYLVPHIVIDVVEVIGKPEIPAAFLAAQRYRLSTDDQLDLSLTNLAFHEQVPFFRILAKQNALI
ncbi:MAG: hypothetical protein M1510_00670 [Nitrospirae bacterium]|nr:hypothetical protein [Nitrospirota bacterium]MCL5236272.1 hypothetical protein [Nitrospirota bacterium]